MKKSPPKKTVKVNIFAEIAGWYGALAIIGAYFMISLNLISSSSLVYQLLNLTGAIGILIISLYKRTKQTVILNIFWAAIAIFAITQIFLGRK